MMNLAVDWANVASKIDWVNVALLLVAVVSVFIAARALGYSRRSAEASDRSADASERSASTSERSAEESDRSADASERSATASERSADAADRSATAAEDAATTAAAMARIEASNRHDQMSPDLDTAFQWQRNQALGNLDLVVQITNKSRRDYQIRGHLVSSGGGQSDIGYRTLRVGQTEMIHVGNERTNLPERLELAFDTGEPCPCSAPGTTDGHWRRSFVVDIPPDPRPRVGGLA